MHANGMGLRMPSVGHADIECGVPETSCLGRANIQTAVMFGLAIKSSEYCGLNGWEVSLMDPGANHLAETYLDG